ncbi:unnamed protein product [Ambrosiozyma monospora]|uniref:Unnamed protein product n=1 Tax=Ambrosiozyma monospora TaxID=43982 RepID=A0A9W6WF50_AMBMO|nr:unnamed protein product [Ambrosiozyma monospora]
MYKEAGLCVDGPNVEYYNKDNCHKGGEYRIGLLKSTNHLQFKTTQRVLNAIFKDGKSGAILTGHDHEGCENFYNLNEENGVWEASKNITSDKFIKEITVRSIMGDFDGNIGIFNGHFNEGSKVWEYDYSVCPFIIQHVWWGAQVTLILSILFHSIAFLF